MTREELGNSVVSTELGGCEEGKVPQKPWTDHMANAWHTSQPSDAVTTARHGAGGGGLPVRRWKTPRMKHFFVVIHTHTLGDDKKPRRQNNAYDESRIFPAISLYEKATGKQLKNLQTLPNLLPGKK